MVTVTSKITQRNPGWLEELMDRYRGNEVLAIGYPIGTEATSTRYPDGTDVLLVAATNNFGSVDGHVPRRAFMEDGAVKSHQATAPLIPALICRVNAGTLSKPQALRILGPVAVAQHQAAITEMDSPPNAPSTIERKQSDNPLIDTG